MGATSVEKYIFIFGSGQRHAGHYVEIVGTYEEARAEMFNRYGDQWAFQYSEKEWDNWVKKCADLPFSPETPLED